MKFHLMTGVHFIELNVETSAFYILRLQMDGPEAREPKVTYLMNLRPIDTLPNTVTTRKLLKIYQDLKEELHQYTRMHYRNNHQIMPIPDRAEINNLHERIQDALKEYNK